MNAKEFVQMLEPRSDHATVITLSGELGAGKTTFSQKIAAELGVTEQVTSPTFVLEKMYALRWQKWKKLVHIDAYRMDDAKEFDNGLMKLIDADPHNIVLIEWPEKMEKLIPADAIRVHIDIEGKERIISINGEKAGTLEID